MDERYDVVVVGGGPAGLSGATALVRSRRSVLVVDAGEPRNAPAAHAHNVLSRDGVPPLELLAAGRAEVASYGGEFRSGRAVSAERDDAGFVVTLADGSQVRGRRLLVTSGLVDELPDVPGLRERWGRDVLHCPYCHGWEVRDQAVGVLATSPMATHQAQLFRQLTDQVTVLTHTGVEFTDQQQVELAARGIRTVPGEVVGLEVDGNALSGVRLASGDVVPLQALVVAPRFVAGSELLESLGLTAEPVEMGGIEIGRAVPAAERTGASAVPGVFLAGNVTDLGAQVVSSASAGLLSGAAVNADLVAEDTRRAVSAHKLHGARPAFDQDFWEDLYREAPARWSGRPNVQLVAEASGLTPGSALDVGSGEGGDAIWLAQRGWEVTGTDISTIALSRAAGAAEAAGVTVGWLHSDLTQDELPGTFDLVSAQYMHLRPEQRRRLHDRLAAAVAPGGTLLLVAHEEPTGEHPGHGWDMSGMFFTAAEEAAQLDPAEWEVLVAEHRPRTTIAPDGREISRPDVVVRARRRS